MMKRTIYRSEEFMKLKPYKSLQEYFKFVYAYRGHQIFDTLHSVEQYRNRVDLDIIVYYNVLKKAIDYLYKNKKVDIEDRYIFRSKEYGFGIQLEWRRDRYDMRKLNGFTATTLSDKEMKYYTQADKEVFVEQNRKRGYTLEESVESIEKSYNRLELPFNIEGYDVFCECGKIYYNFDMVEV